MKRKLRVLHILNRLNIGGVSLCALNLCEGLQSVAEVQLISGLAEAGEGSAESLAHSMGIRPILIPEMQRAIAPRQDYVAYKILRQRIRDFQPDVVHTHAAKPGALGRLAAKHENVPVILHTFHGHIFENYFGKLKSQVFIQIERYLASLSSGIIAISEQQKNALATQFKIAAAKKIHVVHNGFSFQKFEEQQTEKRTSFRKKWNIADDETVIGCIGRLTVIKNLSLLLESIALLKKRLPQKKIKLLLVGDGEEKAALQVQAAALGIAKNCVFTSWLSEVEVALAGMDIVALTSLNEGTPTALIEAQAAAKPIVATRVGGVADTLLENESGLLAASGDVEQLTAHFQRLIEKSALAKTMGEAGRRFVQSAFSLETMLADTLAVYQKCLKSRQKITDIRF